MYWHIISQDLTQAFNEMFPESIMPSQLTEGLIYLIPKSDGVFDDVRKWRPITILNRGYKIIAKAIALRLQPFMSDLIDGSQSI